MAWASESLNCSHLLDEQHFLTAMRADELDDRVEVGVRDLEPLEDVRTLLGARQVERGAPPDDLLAVVDVLLKDVLQR